MTKYCRTFACLLLFFVVTNILNSFEFSILSVTQMIVTIIETTSRTNPWHLNQVRVPTILAHCGISLIMTFVVRVMRTVASHSNVGYSLSNFRVHAGPDFRHCQHACLLVCLSRMVSTQHALDLCHFANILLFSPINYYL